MICAEIFHENEKIVGIVFSSKSVLSPDELRSRVLAGVYRGI